jgi:hypothetical protein
MRQRRGGSTALNMGLTAAADCSRGDAARPDLAHTSRRQALCARSPRQRQRERAGAGGTDDLLTNPPSWRRGQGALNTEWTTQGRLDRSTARYRIEAEAVAPDDPEPTIASDDFRQSTPLGS